jgi:hypothetical protein
MNDVLSWFKKAFRRLPPAADPRGQLTEHRTKPQEFRHTGLWPFSILPPTRMRRGETAQGQSTVKVFDPVALAWKAGRKLIDADWIGLALMDQDWLWKVVDADPRDVPPIVESWAQEHRQAIAGEFEKRLNTYACDDLARTAMTEAIEAYRRGHYVAAVRTLMPEVERGGRLILDARGAIRRTQKDASEAIKDYVDNLPVSEFEPIESLSIAKVVSEDLFARCFTTEDAEKLRNGLNRHAELHGLDSYGDLRGATKMLAVQDFLLHGLSWGAARQ